MKRFLNTLKEKGRTLVTIIDPHIQQNADYHVAEILNKNSNHNIFLYNRLFSS